MHTLTYSFPGPPHCPPITSLIDGHVTCYLHPSHIGLSTNGTTRVLGTVLDREHVVATSTWTYSVGIHDSELSEGAVAEGKFLPVLSGFTPTEELLLTMIQA